jgi:hypothetical protein
VFESVRFAPLFAPGYGSVTVPRLAMAVGAATVRPAARFSSRTSYPVPSVRSPDCDACAASAPEPTATSTAAVAPATPTLRKGNGGDGCAVDAGRRGFDALAVFGVLLVLSLLRLRRRRLSVSASRLGNAGFTP